jgi:hypothetical protein
MRNQQYQTTTPRQRLAIGLSLFALLLIAAIVGGYLASGGNYFVVSITILGSVAIMGGVLGLLIFTARQLDWPLLSFLQIPLAERDENWRLLAMSVAAIIIPLIVIFTRSLLLH